MTSKKKIIVANWKMNPVTFEQAKKIFTRVKRGASRLKRTQAVICPPFLFLGLFAEGVTGNRFVLGAQDLFWELAGAYTGEISPSQLFANKIRHVIVGHSERRALGETDEMVSKRLQARLKKASQLSFVWGKMNATVKVLILNLSSENFAKH